MFDYFVIAASKSSGSFNLFVWTFFQIDRDTPDITIRVKAVSLRTRPGFLNYYFI